MKTRETLAKKSSKGYGKSSVVSVVVLSIYPLFLKSGQE